MIVHRPELSLMRLTPGNKDELLYDDVLRVGQAQKKHDAFVIMMRERGIEVSHHQEPLAQAVNASPDLSQGTLLANRLAGILLTAIAVVLLVNGFTDLGHFCPAPPAGTRAAQALCRELRDRAYRILRS